jgi:DNA polymerase III subunit delta
MNWPQRGNGAGRGSGKLSEKDFIAAIESRPDIAIFLIFGADDSAIADIAAQMATRLGPDVERVDIDSDRIRNDPAILADEAGSMSLFGKKRYIRLNFRREEGLAAVENLLSAPRGDCPVIATAGNLTKASKLRKLAESSPLILCHICYAANEGDAVAVILSLANAAGLRLDRALATRMARYTGNDRKLAAIEVEKLALYHDAATDRPMTVDPHAFAALSAETGEENVQVLINQLLGGQVRQFGVELLMARQMGIDSIRIVRAIQRRVALLIGLRAKVDEGATPDALVRATHAVFFMERPSVTDQLGRWTSAKLSGLNGHLLEIESRLMAMRPDVGAVYLGQELVRIVRMAARGR